MTSIDPTRFRRVFGGGAALGGAAVAVEFSPACVGAAAWAGAACLGAGAAAATTGGAGAVMAPGCFGAVSAAAVPCAPAIAGVGAALGGGYMAAQGGSSNQAPPSNNQVQKQIEKGQAPKDVDRIDYKNLSEFEQPHIHFRENNSALNRDGTWKHGEKSLTNAEMEWLKSIGWGTPQ